MISGYLPNTLIWWDYPYDDIGISMVFDSHGNIDYEEITERTYFSDGSIEYIGIVMEG